MAIHAPGYNPPQPDDEKTKITVDVVQAPTGGIDARVGVGMMAPDVTLFTYNMMPAEYGMLLRDGFTQWITGLGTSDKVYTLIPTLGLDPEQTDNRLFACTTTGIYRVDQFDNPSLELTFSVQIDGTGHGVFCHYVDQAVKDWIFYADSHNGLFEYDGVADTWAPNTLITGPVTADINFCMVHKQRLWVAEKNASSAWYLDVAAIGGAATEFQFGAKFLHGGRVAGLFTWTVDGGVGVDDLFVVISTAGDVIVYAGSSPAAAETWEIVGSYYVGEIPRGNRFVGSYAGDLYILSSFGLTAMSDLLKGVDSVNKAEGSLAYKVARPLREAITGHIEEYGWEPIFLPPNGHLVIMTPWEEGLGFDAIQYVMNLSTEAWGLWQGVPALSLASFQGVVYLGDRDGNVWAMTGHTDRGTIAEPINDAVPVTFDLVSATQHYNSPGLFKQVQMVRPDFWANELPDFNIDVRYDYDYSAADYNYPGSPATSDPSGGVKGFSKLGGTSGMGRTVTIALKGSSVGECRLVSWDVMWKTGGPI